MANTAKLRNLGTPPGMAEARADLAHGSRVEAPARTLARGELPQEMRADRIDGRTIRRTGRNIQFATPVTAEFDLLLRQLAQRDNLLLVEVLERAVDLYVDATSKKTLQIGHETKPAVTRKRR